MMIIILLFGKQWIDASLEKLKKWRHRKRRIEILEEMISFERTRTTLMMEIVAPIVMKSYAEDLPHSSDIKKFLIKAAEALTPENRQRGKDSVTPLIGCLVTIEKEEILGGEKIRRFLELVMLEVHPELDQQDLRREVKKLAKNDRVNTL